MHSQCTELHLLEPAERFQPGGWACNLAWWQAGGRAALHAGTHEGRLECQATRVERSNLGL